MPRPVVHSNSEMEDKKAEGALALSEEQAERVVVLVDEKAKLLKIFCPLCRFVFQDPYVSSCGHTYCHGCIATTDESVKCPLDNCELSAVVRNIAVAEQVGELLVYCRYGYRPHSTVPGEFEVDPSSCREIMKLSERKEHESTCLYAPISCPNSSLCGTLIRKELTAHLRDCQYTKCPHYKFGCDFEGTKDMLEEHSRLCKFEGVKGYLHHLDATVTRLTAEVESKNKQLEEQAAAITELKERLDGSDSLVAMTSKRMEHIEKQQKELMDELSEANSNISMCLVLISTDVKATAQLILMDFPLELAEVTYKLQSNPDMQFQFLDGVFDPKIASKQQDIQPPNHVAERYIELLCQFQPENVYPFLRINDCYRLEEALDVCAAANVIDATSYLLERTGDVKGAFKLILQTFESNLASFCDRFSQPLDSSAAEDTVGQQDVLQSLGVESSRNDDFQSQLERVEVVLRTLLQFCQRNSVRADEKSRQAMWLPMFDQLLGMLYQCQDTPTNLLQALKRMFSEVLNGMMGYVQLPEILRRIIEDPSYGSGQFKDIKPILMKMLETYNYEETLLKTTNHIMVHDVQASLSLLCSLSHKGMIPSSTNCSLCNRPVYAANNEAPIEEVAVFSCGHLYHAPCLSASHPTLGVSCLLCDKSSKASDRSRAVAVRSWDMKNSADPYHRKQALAKSEGSQLDHSQLQQLRRLTRSFSHTTDTVAPVELILAPPKLEHSH